MIVCKNFYSSYSRGVNESLRHYVFVDLYTGPVPSPMPENAVGIENFPQNFDLTKVVFAPGCTLYCAESADVYVTDDNYQWKLQ